MSSDDIVMGDTNNVSSSNNLTNVAKGGSANNVNNKQLGGIKGKQITKK